MARKMDSQYSGRCKAVLNADTGDMCGATYEKGAKIYYAKDAGGVVGCPTCKPELRENHGASTWVVEVVTIKKSTGMGDGSFVRMIGRVTSCVGPDLERWETINSADKAVDIGFGDKSVHVGGQIEFVGPLGTSIKAGDQCRVLGALEDHDRYGTQVKALGPAVLEVVEGDEGTIAFLKRLPFVGDIRAQALVAEYGSGPELWDALENHPETIAEKVSGITAERALKISAEYKSSSGIKDAYVALSGQALSPKLIARALENWDKHAPTILASSVYTLLTLDQSWADTDRTALAQGYATDDPRRVAAIAYRLSKAIEMTGSTWAAREELLGAFRPIGTAVAALDETDASTADTRSPLYRTLVECGAITLKQVTNVLAVGSTRGLIPQSVADLHHPLKALAAPPLLVSPRAPEAVFPRKLAYLEYMIANSVKRLTGGSLHPWRPLLAHELAKAIDGFTLAPEQLAALDAVRLAPMAVLTGGPGTGKTMVVKAIVALAKANGAKVRICAPTGKAAQVITQATGEQGTTAHRLLAPTGVLDDDDDGVTAADFASLSVSKDPGMNGIVCDLLVADESSFLDVDLTDKLLSQLRTGTRILFVGDVDQLPSVGPGAVLRDFIESLQIRTERLLKIFRTRDASPIPHIAADIRDGVQPEWPTDSESINVIDVRGKAGAAAGVSQIDAARWTADTIVKLVTETIPKRKKGGATSGFDVTVIASQRRGECGVETLNAKLQAALNPDTGLTDTIFIGRGQQVRPGDIIKQFKNNKTLMVFNGEVGRVIATSKDGKVLSAPRFRNATLMVPNGVSLKPTFNRLGMSVKPAQYTAESDGAQSKGDGEGGLAPVKAIYASVEDNHVLVAEFPGVVVGTVRYIAYTKNECQKMELGYALTVHASQGSTFKCVVFAVPNQHAFTLTRSNVYTAVTRTSDYLAIVGEPEAITAALTNNHDKTRRTRLCGLLRNVLGAEAGTTPSQADRRKGIVTNEAPVEVEAPAALPPVVNIDDLMG